MTSGLSDIESTVKSIITPWIAKKARINLVIGVIQGGDRWTKGWGAIHSSESNQTYHPDEKTLYEIGSITKVFTTTLLSLLVEQGKLTFTTPINQLGAVYQRFPDTVTLESLATHTSGLPRLPSNLMKSIRQDQQNPYAAYTIDDLHEYLQSYDGKPGKTVGTVSYSNLGVGLLGHILAEQLGQPYEEAIIQHICNPLGLSDTRIALTDEQQARFAIGYSEAGKPVKPWNLPTLAGAGALRSTANDLLTLLVANLHPEQSAIATAILNTHQLRHKTFAPTPGVAGLIEKAAKVVQRFRGQPLVVYNHAGITLSWFVEYLPSLDHSAYTFAGGTGGYRSFCGFIKDTQTGVVVLSNYADILGSRFGRYSTGAVGLKILEAIHLSSGS
ncbi:MAG: serine hydrolase domain-containing protein [Elainellaceae cyanobacterium]